MKISAVIPVYNSQATIGRAIDSVLKQTRSADEIIVIDDGSTDSTAEIIRSYGDKIRLIQQENAGVSVARNAGIEAAAGDWIAFLDADDEWLPEKLRMQAEQLNCNPDLQWTYSNFYQKPDQKPLQIANVPEKSSAPFQAKDYFEDYLKSYISRIYAWTSTILISRDVFKKVGMFEPGVKRAEDTDLWFRIAYQHPKVGYLSKPLAIYHLDTPGSLTKINDDVYFLTHFVRRHEKLSKEYHHYETFYLCAKQMLQTSIRMLVRQNCRKDAMVLLEQFNAYLPSRFRREIQFRMAVPFVGSMIVEMIFWIKEKCRRK